VTVDLGQPVELRDGARGFDDVAEGERPGVERRAEEIDAGTLESWT
jgi:hypothetical protein